MTMPSEEKPPRVSGRWSKAPKSQTTLRVVDRGHVPAAPWERGLVTRYTARGPVTERIVANGIAILAQAPEWVGALAFDEFAQRLAIVGPCPAEPKAESFPIPWTDIHDVRTQAWLQTSEWRLNLGITDVSNAVIAVARETTVHPLREYLNGLEWDGAPRLDAWLPTYARSEDTAYTRMVGAKWMIQAVARGLTPGCKADHTLIFLGEQGKQKSTAARVLGGDFFTDEIADLGSKDAAMQLCGAWIVELAELDAFQRSDVSRIKAFLTKTKDRFRLPYGRHVVERDRQCTFLGTGNQPEFLRDETGGRRFWPVNCGTFDIEALKHDRDQLWAEAVARFSAGEKWHLADEASISLASGEQEARYEVDAWEAIVETWLAARDSASVADVLGGPLGIEKSKWGRHEQVRVGRCLRRLGWDRRQVRNGLAREWRYFKPSPISRASAQSGDATSDTGSSTKTASVTKVTRVTKSLYRGIEIPHTKSGGGGVTGDSGDDGDSEGQP